MQDAARSSTTNRNPASRDFALHYFLRPDHRDVSDLWLASGSHEDCLGDCRDPRMWLFLHLEDLHRSGACTSCAINRHTGGLAGFITVHPGTGRLDQIVVAKTARGSGVATLLLDEAKRMATGPIELDISEENERAIHFCEREGFRKTRLAGSSRGDARIWKLRWQPNGNL